MFFGFICKENSSKEVKVAKLVTKGPLEMDVMLEKWLFYKEEEN